MGDKTGSTDEPGRTPTGCILVVDDVPHVREDLCSVLEHAGHETVEAGDGRTALREINRGQIDAVLLDLQIPRRSGMEVLRQVADEQPELPVVIVSGKGTIRTAVEATKLGAYDFLEKPVDAQRTLVTVRNALERSRLQRQRDRLLDEAKKRYRMVGSSSPMQRVYGRIDKAAQTTSKVLIVGENGSGKELVARAIHHNSARAGEPFVTVNCAAIPESLIESELFGHEKGAFTGAKGQRVGTFEQADEGTLFLDEIGDMSLAAQAKTLRALEEGEIRRVGSEAPIEVDVRIIAATNKNLSAEIDEGRFREDLYWRLNVVSIEVPPLRQRRKDIPVLVDHFMERFAEENGLPPREVRPAAMAELMSRDWPGNIRQLKNAVERLVVLNEQSEITARVVREVLGGARDSGVQSNDGSQSEEGLRAARARFERAYIEQVLRRHDGAIQETADALGIDRSHLWKKMKRYDIEGLE